MKKKIIFAVKIFISISLIAFLFSKLDLSSFEKLSSDILIYLFFSTLVVLIALLIMTIRWKIVLNLIETKEYSFLLLYKFYLIGGFFSIFIPGAIGGDAMRFYYVSKFYQLTKKKSLLSVFIERIAGLFALGIILMFSLIFNNTIREKLDFGYTTILLTSVGILIVLIVAKHLVNKKVCVSYSDMSKILLFSGLGQFGDIFIAYIFCEYFNLNITLLNLMSIMPLVYIATVIPISLGGVGVREGVMTAGMALYGVDISDAVIVSFLLYLSKISEGFIGWYYYLRIGTVKTDYQNKTEKGFI